MNSNSDQVNANGGDTGDNSNCRTTETEHSICNEDFVGRTNMCSEAAVIEVVEYEQQQSSGANCDDKKERNFDVVNIATKFDDDNIVEIANGVPLDSDEDAVKAEFVCQKFPPVILDDWEDVTPSKKNIQTFTSNRPRSSFRGSSLRRSLRRSFHGSLRTCMILGESFRNNINESFRALRERESRDIYDIIVPKAATPGEFFYQRIQDHLFRVLCPESAVPGKTRLTIAIPKDSIRPHPKGLPPNSKCVIRIPYTSPSSYLVMVPEDVVEGQTFQITVEGELLLAKGSPGRQVWLTPAKNPSTKIYFSPKKNKKSSNNNDNNAISSAAAENTSSNVTPLPENPSAFMVTVPEDACGGQVFSVTINGKQHKIKSPTVTVSKTYAQQYQVKVPKNVKPGDAIGIYAGGYDLTLICPAHASSGDTLRFEVPVQKIGDAPAVEEKKLATKCADLGVAAAGTFSKLVRGGSSSEKKLARAA